MFECADAAAKLHGIFRGFQNRFNGLAIFRLAGKCAVKIDDVKPFESLILEFRRLGGRIGIVNPRGFHVAESKTYAFAVFQVDGGEEDFLSHFGFSVQGNLLCSGLPPLWRLAGFLWIPA